MQSQGVVLGIDFGREVRSLKLEEYLRLSGASQNQFARKAGVAQTTVSRIVKIENGLHEDEWAGVTRRIAVKIMFATNGCVSVNDLMQIPSHKET